MKYPTYEHYKDSGVSWLGKVPENWAVKPLKHLVAYNSETLSDSTEPDLAIKYVDISSVSLVEGITKIEEFEFEKAPSRARRIVRDGDTIVSTVRTYLKAIAAIRDPDENLIVSTGFAVIRPKSNINPDYLGYFLQSEGFVGEVVSRSVGVSYPAINATDLVRIEALLPAPEEQKSIVEFLDAKTAEIDVLISGMPSISDVSSGSIPKMAKLIHEYRRAIITSAVTGKIDVRGYQQKQEAA